MGDLGSIPRLGRSTGGGKGCPLQCSGLENSMDQLMGSQRVGHDSLTFTSLHKELEGWGSRGTSHKSEELRPQDHTEQIQEYGQGANDS